MKRRPRFVLWMSFLTLAIAGSGTAGVFSASAQDATPADMATPAASSPVEIMLTNVQGDEAGTATFEESSDGMVTVSVSVEGLEPGDHGIHVHASGMCDPSGLEPFSTAGPHYNPTGAMHGGPDDDHAHAGDLGNITVGDDGTGTLEISTDAFTLSEGPMSVFDQNGSALVIHRNPDDLQTDPTGQSGGRVACGVVADPMSAPTAATAQVTGNVLNPAQMPFSDDLLAGLEAPEGFEISIFASGLTNPRWMLVIDESTVLVSQSSANQVSVLRDTNGDGIVEESEVLATNLPLVHGMALLDEVVYLAGENTIWTATLEDNGTLGTPEVLVDDLPDGDQHPRHTLNFGPDGMLYVSIGSSCNSCTESNDENATILRMNPDGSDRTIFASGLRNTLAWGWHPDTGELWGIDQGADWRGDDQPPEELNNIVEGGNYGWPFCFAEQQVDEYFTQVPPGSTKAQYCENTDAPALVYQAHSSPIGFVYYTGDQFPEKYTGDAFAAMRGSWNREPAVGYKIVHVQFEDGEPVAIEDFITGWLTDDGQSYFGRVAGLTLMPDGSMLIAEDTNGVIYRVTYSD